MTPAARVRDDDEEMRRISPARPRAQDDVAKRLEPGRELGPAGRHAVLLQQIADDVDHDLRAQGVGLLLRHGGADGDEEVDEGPVSPLVRKEGPAQGGGAGLAAAAAQVVAVAVAADGPVPLPAALGLRLGVDAVPGGSGLAGCGSGGPRGGRRGGAYGGPRERRPEATARSRYSAPWRPALGGCCDVKGRETTCSRGKPPWRPSPGGRRDAEGRETTCSRGRKPPWKPAPGGRFDGSEGGRVVPRLSARNAAGEPVRLSARNAAREPAGLRGKDGWWLGAAGHRPGRRPAGGCALDSRLAVARVAPRRPTGPHDTVATGRP